MHTLLLPPFFSMVSETGYSFTARSRGPHSGRPGSQSSIDIDVDRSKSNVFRAGDYNASHFTPEDHFVSVQMKDYVVSPVALPSTRVSTAKQYQSAHEEAKAVREETLHGVGAAGTDTFTDRSQV